MTCSRLISDNVCFLFPVILQRIIFIYMQLRHYFSNPRFWATFWLICPPLVAAMALKLFILPISRMPFDSDEAIFLLMARHILAGERPLFFYGEAYGGSADAYLTALFYYFFGDTITIARLVQSLEYGVGIFFTYLLARRLLPQARFGPLAVLWLMAIPPLLMSTWTTPAVLYAVVICLGSIISYLGHRLLYEDADHWGQWLIFGFICGLAFWTFGILVVYMVPVFLLFLWQFQRQRLPKYIAGAAAFFLGSWPWWTQALEGLLVVYNPGRSTEIPFFLFRLLAFFVITLPGFVGIRDPWGSEIIWPVVAPFILLFYLLATLYVLPRFRRNDPKAPALESLGFRLLGLQVVVWGLLYFGTRFSLDATGRYILPLYPVLFIIAGLFLERLYRWRKFVAMSVLLAVLSFNLATHLRAVQITPPGITAQMNLALWLSNEWDGELIEFVKAQGGRGYSHHWISYKIAFLSHEEVILAAFLPYRPDLRWIEQDNRYAPYVAAVATSPNPVYVTQREPNLEAYLQKAFAAQKITYQIEDIGPYRVYHGLSQKISPPEIGLGLAP